MRADEEQRAAAYRAEQVRLADEQRQRRAALAGDPVAAAAVKEAFAPVMHAARERRAPRLPRPTRRPPGVQTN